MNRVNNMRGNQQTGGSDGPHGLIDGLKRLREIRAEVNLPRFRYR